MHAYNRGLLMWLRAAAFVPLFLPNMEKSVVVHHKKPNKFTNESID